jgi:hypothetical protein
MRRNGRCGLRGGNHGFCGCCGKDSDVNGNVNTTSGPRLMYNSIVMVSKPRLLAVFVTSTCLKDVVSRCLVYIHELSPLDIIHNGG